MDTWRVVDFVQVRTKCVGMFWNSTGVIFTTDHRDHLSHTLGKKGRGCFLSGNCPYFDCLIL